ncbi:MAG: hypothetical protein IH865_05885 [Chloroflexi bacterium]|nr:hypothetical protein [Chloroflexota bacterium]
MHLSNPLVRLSFGLVAIFALAMVVVAIGMSSDSPSATAEGPVPTKIANDGNLSGVSDILVGDLATNVSLFYCIGKTDHQESNNAIKTALQCNIDLPGSGDDPTNPTPPGWCDLANACNQANNAADLTAGPPPPPPYSTLPPSKGYGFFYPTGSPAECGGTPCTVTLSCFQDVGQPGGLGPNIISKAVILNPKTPETVTLTVLTGVVDEVTTGFVDIWYNKNNANCKNAEVGIDPGGAPSFGNLALFSIAVSDKGGANPNPNPVPWRPSGLPGATLLDFDGDGCTDEDELSKNSTAKCGDDPQNPSDSFDENTVDLSGIYGIGVTVLRNDCTDDSSQAQCIATHETGFYFSCAVDLQHNTGDNTIVARPYCYIDLPGLDINAEAYPGASGDGAGGGTPPGPQVADYPSGFTSWVYGDVDEFHTVLTGVFNKDDNTIEISGCFIDQDGFGGLGNVWVELDISAHQIPGEVSVFAGQPAGCDPAPTTGASVSPLSFTLLDGGLKGKTVDGDNDGVPTARELGDDDACGRRDPSNGNDYYDVSVPRDGVIDLSNDILGVIQHYSPGGYVTLTPDVLGGIPDVTTFDNFDRPPTMTNAHGGTWNRGSPDGVIDLSNDILGVILQYNPGGC